MTPPNTDAPYTSRIIKASALLTDTRVLLENWRPERSPEENLQSARAQNIFAKATRKRIDDILAIFRQRYASNPDVANALAIIANSERGAGFLTWLLYFYAARNDRMLHDVVTEFLAARRQQGFTEVAIVDLEALIQQWVREGKTIGAWSDETLRRVAQGVMATLRDFGVLAGRAHKHVAAFALPVEAFAFIAFALAQDEKSGAKLLRHPDWRLFFLEEGDVERLFVEAHQRRLLSYHAAGRVIRVDFPFATLEGAARAVIG